MLVNALFTCVGSQPSATHFVRSVHHGQGFGVPLLYVSGAVGLSEHSHAGLDLPQLGCFPSIQPVSLVGQ